MNDKSREHPGPKNKTAVLLGAGASVDAGLLATAGLADKIIGIANQGDSLDKDDAVRALNAAYSGMIGYQGTHGENPLERVNIETLISAVRLLANRDTHEVAPFVASWSSSLSDFKATDISDFPARKLLEAIGRSIGNPVGNLSELSRITKAVADIARESVKPDLNKPFSDAERFILRKLIDLLGRPTKLDYLKPLLELAKNQPQGADVITLNYDLTVEMAAEQGGVQVNTAIESWRPGRPLDFPSKEGVLNLVKVHGSLNWRRKPPEDKFFPHVSARGMEEVELFSQDDSSRHDARLPWIVVGDRDKLGTDGPTLALNFAAREALQRANHLAVVGYSFRDPHINSLVRDWLAECSSRTMNILDNKWIPYNYQDKDKKSFRTEMVEFYGVTDRSRDSRLNARIQPLVGTAGNLLNEAINSRPAPDPDTLSSGFGVLEADSVRLEITWHGRDLSDARVSAEPGGASVSAEPNRRIGLYQSLPLPDEDASGLYGGKPSVKFDSWPSGTTKTIHAFPEVSLPIDLRIDGATIIGSQDDLVEIKDCEDDGTHA